MRVTKEQKKIILDNYELLSNREIADLAGVRESYVKNFLCLNGITRTYRHYLVKSDDVKRYEKVIGDKYENTPTQTIADELGISPKYVRKIACELGIKKMRTGRAMRDKEYFARYYQLNKLRKKINYSNTYPERIVRKVIQDSEVRTQESEVRAMRAKLLSQQDVANYRKNLGL